ncbi:MAG TPA: MFS transporter [Burkholderiales bacterium]|jgi:MFS family permease|nr:MFS transporter [Burkholderiales bacterium]
MELGPASTVTPEALERGKRALVRDAAWASMVGSLYGGVVLVGFALQLGATPLDIGILAAIPFFAQIAQIPAIALVERLRERKRIGISSVSASRLIIACLALLALVPDDRVRLVLLFVCQAAITVLGSVSGCALNSWMHQLLAGQNLGELFSRRLFWSTVLASLGALAAGQLVQHWPGTEKLHAYAIAFIAAGIAGFVSIYYLSQVPEPRMQRTGPHTPLLEMLRAPFLDADFRRVIVFMMSWNFASNLAAPFLTVYLLQQLGYGLGTVTTLWISSQVANALTMYLWGRISDRLTNKAILAVAVPAYLGCLVAFPFSAIPHVHALTLPLLYLIHVIMGAASGGIGLATGNLGLKLAPQGRGTSFLAAVGLAGAAAGGLASLTGGALADWFSARELNVLVHWASASASHQITVIKFQHWEFLFAISFLLGWYVLHALSRINEGSEHSERQVIQQFVEEASRSLSQLSPIEGLRSVLLFPFGRLRDRRLKAR